MDLSVLTGLAKSLIEDGQECTVKKKVVGVVVIISHFEMRNEEITLEILVALSVYMGLLLSHTHELGLYHLPF